MSAREWWSMARIVWVLALVLWLAGCAHIRPAPPVEAWPLCEAICGHQGGISLGIILQTPEGPVGCACATEPKAFPGDEA